jgi:hypothetical protein
MELQPTQVSLREVGGFAPSRDPNGSFSTTHLAAQGRQREYADFGCRRSAGTISRSMLVTCERLLSPTLICSMASAKVRFEGRPAARRENRHRLLWVGHGRPVSVDGRRVYDIHRPFTGGWQLSVNQRPLGRIA